MAKIFITGSTDGIGLLAAQSLMEQGHEVVWHARNEKRADELKENVPQVKTVLIADLSKTEEVKRLAEEVNKQGHFDAVIHNAGVWSGNAVMPVNVIAPYLLTSLIDMPERLVFLSSGMHKSGNAVLEDVDWTGHTEGSYSDSKLFITTLAAALALKYPQTYVNAVDPGWVPTKMGGDGATDDLTLGHQTQEWLATSTDKEALTSGGCWYHKSLKKPHEAVNDTQFQQALLRKLAQETGVELTE